MKKDKKPVVLVIDANHAAHRSAHTLTHLKHKGKATNVPFGILNILSASCGIYKPEKTFLCWDDGRHEGRLKIYPGYKQREQKIDFDYKDFHRQNEVTRKIVKALGIPQFHRKGQEADDYIYRLCRIWVKKGYRVIIVSGDKDFNQLVSQDVWVHNSNKGVITPHNFKKLVGVSSPEQFVDYLSMVGDDSDKIPGVKGIGEKTAVRLLEQHGSLKNYIAKGPTDRFYDSIIEGTGVSKPLIDLKWFFVNVMKKAKLEIGDYYKGKKKPKKNKEKYLKLLAKQGISRFAEPEFYKAMTNG